MDETWHNYPTASGHRQSQGSSGPPQQQQRESRNGSSHRPQPSSGLAYEAYHAPPTSSYPQDTAMSTPRSRAYSGDQDVSMEDADPYNRTKYPSRSGHQRRPSAYLANEDSSAARRYSPMKALSPGGQYSNPQTPQQANYNSYNSPAVSARQSPTRSNHYSTPSQTYSTASEGPLGSPGRRVSSKAYVLYANWTLDVASNSRQQNLHLPPIQVGDSKIDNFYPTSATAQLNAVFGREARSPRVPRSQQHDSSNGRGPGPKFRSVKHSNDLESRINAQPAFRRANPEGGFISVS